MADNRARQIEDVRGSGIYPATGPLPPGDAVVRSPAALAHPEERMRPVRDTAGMEKAALLAGRAIFGGFFLYNGINHFVNRSMMAEYARGKGVPAADMAVAASGLMLIAGGASMITGVRPKIGAGLITGFLLGVSPSMHAFWKARQPEERMQEYVNFTKNLALVGASLIVAAHPEPWPWHLGLRARGAMARSIA